MTIARRIPLALGVVALSLSWAACSPDNNPPDNTGCSTDADCASGRLCDNGQCIECREATDCGDGQACCNAECVDNTSPEAQCGCAEARNGNSGQACDALELCVAAGARVDADSLSEGTCQCTCDPSQGGTLCTADEQAAMGFACTCDRTNLATCERPALDTGGQPHVVADTCSPDEACVCFYEGQACDPNGANPDCVSGNCTNLYSDDDSCGVEARDCSTDGTGQCRNGGCSCDAPTQCQGTGLNVDQCVFLTAGAQCVCDDYTILTEKAACPLGLNCVDGGCLLDGTIHATAASLYTALGIDAPPVAPPDPGNPPDAGTPMDAGGGTDAGGGADSGVTDAGSAADAGGDAG